MNERERYRKNSGKKQGKRKAGRGKRKELLREEVKKCCSYLNKFLTSITNSTD